MACCYRSAATLSARASILASSVRCCWKIITGCAPPPVVGMAAYTLGDRQLAFADPSGRVLDAKPSGFHCWVEAEDTLIDFQAPLFPEAIARLDSSVRLPRRMLQKPLSTTSDTPLDLTTGGTHWLQGDPELHRTLLTEFTDVPANVDLAQIASEWYRPSPTRLREFITVGDGRGRQKTVSLSPIRLDGAW